MSKMTRKLFLSIIAVVLTVFALGSTTFAWFTLTSTASVEAFEAEIVSDSGIELALVYDDIADPLDLNWKTTLLAQDVTDFIADQIDAGFTFNHVTSADGRVFYDLNGDSTTAGFLEIPIAFRSDDVTELDWESVSLTSGSFTWNSDTVFTNEQGVAQTASSSFNVNAADAMRISITGDIAATATTVVYENPASTTNVVLGENTAADLTGANGAVSYYTAVSGAAPTGVTSVNTPATLTSISGVKVLDLIDDTTDYGKTYSGTITIRVWFEGWDANAYNTLLGRTISTAFTFKDSNA